MGALPEAFEQPHDREFFLGREPLAYPAFAQARIWLEDDVLEEEDGAVRVPEDRADLVRRFWRFVEEQAEAHRGDEAMETLLAIECFEGVLWIDDVVDWLGPRTRHLLREAKEAGLA